MMILVVFIAFLVVRARNDQWWNHVSFGGEQGSYRVDGGPSRAVGSMGGLFGDPEGLRVAVGSTIEIHFTNDYYGAIVSSNPSVLRSVFTFLSSSQSFRAVSPGVAQLTTTAPGSIWGCLQMSPAPPGTPESQRSGKNCPLFAVAVSSL
jgi:hypothetical protein